MTIFRSDCHLKALGLYLVFIFELVSCNQEKQTQPDPFKIAPPQIERVGMNSLSWKDIRQAEVLELKPSDEIVFSPHAANSSYRLVVDTHCVLGKRTFIEKQSWFQPQRLKIQEIIPIAALLVQPGQIINCRFDMEAINSLGSKHFFQLPHVQWISFNAGDGIRLKKDGFFLEDSFLTYPVLPASEWGDYWIAPEDPDLPITMDCEYHRLKIKTSSYPVIPLTSFDFLTAEARDSSTSFPMNFYPRQLCRITSYTDGHRAKFSPLMEIQIPWLQPKVELTSAKILNNPPIYMGKARIINPFHFALRLQIPKYGQQTAKMVGVYGTPSAFAATPAVTLNFRFDIGDKSKETLVEKLDDYMVVTLPPQQEVTLHLQEPRSHYCHINGTNEPESVLFIHPEEDIGPLMFHPIIDPVRGNIWEPLGRIKILPARSSLMLLVSPYRIKDKEIAYEDLRQKATSNIMCTLQ